MNLTIFPEQHFYTSLGFWKHHVNLLLQHFYNTSWDPEIYKTLEFHAMNNLQAINFSFETFIKEVHDVI